MNPWAIACIIWAALLLAFVLLRRRDRAATIAEAMPTEQEQAAGDYGIDYELREFWPPASYIYNERLPSGLKVWTKNKYLCPEMYDAKIGDMVPVYEDTEGNVYWYVLHGWSRASGDDHIVSPMQFNLRFWHRAPI